MKLALIEWEDITNTADWAEADQVVNWREFEFDHNCMSVGWIVKEAEDHIVLVAQATRDFKSMAMASRIPRGIIRNIYKLTTDGKLDARQ